MRAGQVLAEGVHIALDVDTTRVQEITLGLSSPAGHHIADAPLSQREAIRLRDTLQEAIELVGRVAHSRALPVGLEVADPAPSRGLAGRPKL